MIKNKKDYLNYLEADRIALNKSNDFHTWLQQLLYPDYIWNFQNRKY